MNSGMAVAEVMEEERHWEMLLPLILEHVGNVLELDGRRGDLLRARLACRHWHACLTRCITCLTLYGGAVRLPPPLPPPPPSQAPQTRPGNGQHHLQQNPPREQHHGELLPSPSSMPPTPTPGPQPSYGRHVLLLPSLARHVKHVTLRGPTCDPGDLRALSAALPSLTSLSLQTTRFMPGSTLMTPTTAYLPDAAASAPGGGIGGSAPPGVGEAAAATVYDWPPAPPRLEQLWVELRNEVPPDWLHHLLLPLRCGSTTAAAAAATTAPMPLRELGLLPPVGGRLAESQRMPYIDLSPLLDPRLAGVTRLVLPAMQPREPPPAAAGARQPPPLPPPGHGFGIPHNGQGFAAAAGGGDSQMAVGVEDVVSRLTQLKSLTVLAQVDLPSLIAACLAPLARLECLRLPVGVFCEAAEDLRRLAALSRLTALEINFESEWWMDAGDLCMLSRLAGLRHLSLALDYGLGAGDALSGDELEGLYDMSYGDEDDGDGSSVDERAAAADERVRPPPSSPSHEGDGTMATEALAATDDGELATGRRRRHPYSTLEGLAAALAGAWASARGPARDALLASHSDPGIGDDWRVPLGCLTQLRRLEVRLGNGGGRHLAEALHGVTWLAVPPAGAATSASEAACPHAAVAVADGGVRPGGFDGCSGGATLELRDAPAAAFLDVPYWRKVGAAAVAGITGAGRRSPFLAPPLVALHLGSGRSLCLSHGHVLCLGFLTDLRSLELSFEVAAFAAVSESKAPCRTPAHAAIAAAGGGGGDGCTSNNPLFWLSRLRRLRELRVRIKQPRPSAQRSGDSSRSSGCDGSDDGVLEAPPAVPMDDAVIQCWMEGMPSLSVLALRGVGWLGEGALAAVGRHGTLRSLELRLKPPLLLPVLADDTPQLQIGYGSFYALRAALTGADAVSATAGGIGGGGGGPFGSSAATPLGVSPPTPYGSLMAVLCPPTWDSANAGAARGSVPLQVPADGSDGGGDGAAAAAAAGGGPGGAVAAAAMAAASLGRSAAWRDELLAAGVPVTRDLHLAGVPYSIRPHHLPLSLTSLDLTNAVFSAEWAGATAQPPQSHDDNDQGCDSGGRCSGSGRNAGGAEMQVGPKCRRGRNAGGPEMQVGPKCRWGRNAGGAGIHDGAQRGAAEGGGRGGGHSHVVRPPARLLSLKLARRPPKCQRRMKDQADRRAAAGGASADADPLDPTRITDWHLVHLTARHPTLTRLELYDGGSGAGDDAAAKLHYRAVAHLSRLSYLESLTLQVGNRLRWRAQEALMGGLPTGLRALRLHASHVYAEALMAATRLSALTSLEVVGYAEPTYVAELEAAAAAVQLQLPYCRTLLWHRDVDVC